jgi:hypothetical protein
MTIQFFIVARSAVLISGSNHDFLGCITLAKKYKQRLQTQLPFSTLRIQLRYPNGKRVPSADIKAALRALENKAVATSVAARLSQAVAIPPARSEARTAGIATEPRLRLRANAEGFRQASVVAPPDSPDLGNSWIVVEEDLRR